MSKNGKGKFIVGAIAGLGLGILFAPNKGSETRKQLASKMKELIDKAREIDPEEVKNLIEEKIAEIRTELADLDKEKVLKIAKEKGEELKKRADELVDLAVKKGTPLLEKTANEVREKTIAVLEETIKKLDKKKN